MSDRRPRSVGRSRSCATAISSPSTPSTARSTSSLPIPSSRPARKTGSRARLISVLVISGNTPSRWGRPSMARSSIRAVLLRKSAMRISEAMLRVVVIGAALMAGPALAFDGTKTDGAMAAAPPLSATDAFRSGARWLKAGDKVKAVHSLEYAAENGHTMAQWKLGRMYAEGDGVAQDDLKAFEYF